MSRSTNHCELDVRTAMEIHALMDQAKLKYIQDELVDLFRKLQVEVERLAIQRISARKKKEIRLPEGDTICFNMGSWHNDIPRLESSPEFLNLVTQLEHYRLQFVSPDDEYVTKLYQPYSVWPAAPDREILSRMSPDTSCEICTEEGGLEDEGHDRSAFAYWCRASGFYFYKFETLDLGDWSARFERMVTSIPNEIGQAKCLMCVGTFPMALAFKSVACEKIGLRELEYLRVIQQFDHTKSDGIFNVVNHTPIGLRRGSTVLTKTVRCAEMYSGNEEDLFRNIRSAFQLACPQLVIPQFEMVHSSTLTEPLQRLKKYERAGDFGMRLSLTAPVSLDEDLGEQSRNEKSNNYSSEMTDLEKLVLSEPVDDLAPDTERVPAFSQLDLKTWTSAVGKIGRRIECLFDYNHYLLNNGLADRFFLSNSIHLFDQACLSNNKTVEFLLFVTTLESLFAEGINKDIGERISTRYSLLVGANDDEQRMIKDCLEGIYKRRNAIIHGKDPSVIGNPFSGVVSQNRMRCICRRAIITFLFALDRLRLDNLASIKSELIVYFNSRSRRSPSNKNELCSAMGEFEDNPQFWASIHSTVNRQSALLGFPFDSLLLRIPEN